MTSVHVNTGNWHVTDRLHMQQINSPLSSYLEYLPAALFAACLYAGAKL